ncbi:MAG: hypothetical protein FWG74_08900 [Planctomycetes bacterium]|nr:hypothetical protein [Planctomycetota bacterium]
MLSDKIEGKTMRDRIAPAETAAGIIKDGMTVFFSGYTACGYPKLIGGELVRRKKAGEKLKISLTAGAQVGQDVSEALAEADLLDRCTPLIESKTLARRANAGQVHYVEQQMAKLPRLLRSGKLGHIDVAVVEAIGVTADGGVIPSNSVGMTPAFLEAADQVIVELNLAQPEALRGLHDVYLPAAPPNARPIPLISVKERIGVPYIKVDPAKIRYIVESNVVEEESTEAPKDSFFKSITDNLLGFLEHEAKRNWRGRLFPIQTGFGNLTNAFLIALGESRFSDLEFFCGGVSEGHVRLMERGKVKAVSAGSLKLSPHVAEKLRSDPKLFHDLMVLRNTEICNGAETVSRLGVIAINTGIEVDIYGNLNASHITGSRVVNGLGGGANFAQNALLSVVVIPSAAKGGDISSVVPMVSHHDIIEHDVDVLITENGIADLRGLDELERARAIIDTCAHPSYRDALNQYLQKAVAAGGGHHPVCLPEALHWHERLRETGSMRQK